MKKNLNNNELSELSARYSAIPLSLAGGERKFCGLISRDGKFYSIGFFGHADFIRGVYGIKREDYPLDEDVMEVAFADGWMRACVYGSQDNLEIRGNPDTIRRYYDILNRIAERHGLRVIRTAAGRNWYKEAQSAYSSIPYSIMNGEFLMDEKQLEDSFPRMPISDIYREDAIGWISPSGEFYSCSDYSHIVFMRGKLKADRKVAAGNWEVRMLAFSKGWVRVRHGDRYIGFTGTRQGIARQKQIINQIVENTGLGADYTFEG